MQVDTVAATSSPAFPPKVKRAMHHVSDLTILDIPDEVLGVIFSFLGPKAAGCAIRTCKTFQRIIDENYWEPRARKKWAMCCVEKYGFDWKALYADNNKLSYEGKHEWIVENFSKTDERRLYSPRFEIGGYPWCVLLFPRGNHDPTCLAFYLKPGEDTDMYPMRMARITFTVVNQKDRSRSRTRRCEHLFDRGEPDWGFTSFMRFTELNDPDLGFLEGDRLILQTEVSVVPYRAPQELDPDDLAAVEEVARECEVPIDMARRAYIATRRNEHIHEIQRSKTQAIKNLRAKPQKYLHDEDEKLPGGDTKAKTPVTSGRESDDSDDDGAAVQRTGA